MITSTKPALADQIRALLAQATEQVVPGRVLAWSGNTNFPTGAAPAPALTQQRWGGLYFLLENAALGLGPVKPLPLIDAATRDIRPDDPLPIAIASFRVAVPRASLAQNILGGRLQRRAARLAARAPGRCDRGAPGLHGDGVHARAVGSRHPGASRPPRAAQAGRGLLLHQSRSSAARQHRGRRRRRPRLRRGRVRRHARGLLPAGRQRRDRGALHLWRRGARGADDAGHLRRPGAPARRRQLAAAGAGARRQARRARGGLGLPRPGPQGDRQPRDPHGGVSRGPSLRLHVRAAQRIGHGRRAARGRLRRDHRGAGREQAGEDPAQRARCSCSASARHASARRSRSSSAA